MTCLWDCLSHEARVKLFVYQRTFHDPHWFPEVRQEEPAHFARYPEAAEADRIIRTNQDVYANRGVRP